MKVIFLDIDGVMNNNPFIVKTQHEEGFQAYMSKFDPGCVKNLNRILDAVPDAKIVVSSSWRLHYKTNSSLRRLLMENGIDAGRFVGVTPKRGVHPEARGNEIELWLREHDIVESLVILDDDSDMAHLLPRLVQTDIESGLTEKDADKAIQMLRGPVVK